MDAFRWFTICVGFFSVGSLIACYDRAWRFAPPKWAIRCATSGGIGVSGLAIYGIWIRLGHRDITWQTPVSLAAFLIWLGGLSGFYLWTRTGEGQKARQAAIDQTVARKQRAQNRRRPDQEGSR